MYVCVYVYTCIYLYMYISSIITLTIVGRRGREEGGGRRGRGDCLYMGQLIGRTTLQHV